jgi:hypothetical protein
MEILFEDAHENAAPPPNEVTMWLAEHMSKGWKYQFRNNPIFKHCLLPDGLELYEECRERVSRYFEEQGYPQAGTVYFKHGQRDRILNFHGADGKVEEFLSLIAPQGTPAVPVTGGDGRRKLAAMLCGHTHAIHEFRVERATSDEEADEGTNLFYLDDYSGTMLPGPHSIPESDAATWLAAKAPLLLTSGTLKRATPHVRELAIEGNAILSMKVVFLETRQRLSVRPRFHNFGEVKLGQSQQQRVDLFNTGLGPIWIEEFELTGEGFELDVDTGGGTGSCVEKQLLRPKDGCSVYVAFRPEDLGAYAGELAIKAECFADQGVTVKLAGTCVDSDLEVTPSAHNFGEVFTGMVGRVTLTLSNKGTTRLALAPLRLAGAPFTIDEQGGDSPCASDSPTLFPGESCSVDVTFAPNSSGRFAETLTIHAQQVPTHKAKVELQGVGVSGRPIIRVAPLEIDFGEVEVGDESRRGVSISNEIDATAPLKAAIAPTPFQAAFSWGPGGLNPCEGFRPILGPGEQCGLFVWFRPERAGVQTANIIIRSNDPTQEEVVVSMRGVGQA